MITVRNNGDFSNTVKYLKGVSRAVKIKTLDYYGHKGVEALKAATPVDTGLTANSWYYEIKELQYGSFRIEFCNSNVQKGWAPIALLLQYGHGTRNGGYVEGRDYINPALKPVFDELAKKAWAEVKRL